MNYMMGSDFLKSSDIDAAGAWMENYCRQHPLEKLFHASTILASELARREGERRVGAR